MNKIHKTILLASLAISPITLQAALIQHWDFSEAEGTLLSETAGNIFNGPVFTSDLGSTAMTGNGTLRINRSPGGGNQSQAFLDTSGPQYLRADLTIRGWNLEETTTAHFRLGFTNGTSVQQTADFEIRRNGTDIQFRGFAGSGDNGGWVAISEVALVQNNPIDIRLDYNGTENTFSTYYNLGSGWTELFTGSTAADRNAGALRLYANNSFDSPRYFDLESLSLTAIPEPSTYAVIFGATALIVSAASRRLKQTRTLKIQ